jgi:uncharacterized membrane protein
MNRAVSLVLLVVGLVLLIYGFAASDSAGSAISRLFTGAPTDKTVWLLVGGAVAAVIGLLGVARGEKL